MRQEFDSASELMSHYDGVKQRLRSPSRSVKDTPIDLRRKKGGFIELPILSDEQRQQISIQNWMEKCHAIAERDRKRAEAKRETEFRYPTIEQIKVVVCEHFGVELVDLISERRDRPSARARHVTAYLCRKLTPFSFPKIAKQLGKRDHTTAIASVSRVKELLETDPAIAAAVESLIARLSGGSL